jgi:hypothetical protein
MRWLFFAIVGAAALLVAIVAVVRVRSRDARPGVPAKRTSSHSGPAVDDANVRAA